MALDAKNAKARETDGEPELADKKDGEREIDPTSETVLGDKSQGNENNKEEQRGNEKDRQPYPAKEENEEDHLDDAIASGALVRPVAGMIGGVVHICEPRLGLQGGILARESMEKHCHE
jgi:hypothetical protein